MTDRFQRGGVLASLLLVLVGTGCTAPEPGIARGEDLWETCVPCHGANGEGNQALGAPSIAGLPQWYVQAQLESFNNGWRGSHPMDTIGIRMKSMARTLRVEGDLESVAEYVASLPAVALSETLPGDPALGQQEYASLCVNCHMADGRGIDGVFPPLVGQSDWYLLAQYGKFLDGKRGAHPDDVNGKIMADQAKLRPVGTIANVFAYIRTLQ
jgi:cytochrome c oxidase subunit 2